MKELFREKDLVKVRLSQALLEWHGIRTFIRYEKKSPGRDERAGEQLAILCVVDDPDLETARNIIDAEPEETVLEERLCQECNERCPDGLGSCWICGAVLA